MGEVAYTDGADASELAASVGLALFPWEVDQLALWCSRDASDRPAYVDCGLAVPRQNGKNAILEAYELYEMAVCAAHILHTAHRVKTAKKSFRRLVKYFTDRRHPELTSLVQNIRYTNGEEAIYLANGGSIEFSARSHAGNRGFDDIQIVVFDEAQELDDSQLSAIMYTLAASSTGDRQMIYTGTPPDDKALGTVFARSREVATTAPSPRTLWQEWSVERMPARGATFPDVLESVYATNPSMGYVLDEEFTQTEFAKSDLLGFAIERLGYWKPALRADAAIPKALWSETAIDAIGTAYTGKRAFGLKFSPDGSTYVLAGCKLGAQRGKRRELAAVEVVEVGTTEGGTKALARQLWERRQVASVVLVDGMAAALAMRDNLAELKCPQSYVPVVRASDVVAASQGLVDSLSARTVAHTPQAALDASAAGSVRRPVGRGGGWGFGSDGASDSTAIEACALALYGARTSKRNPRRRQRRL